MMTLAFMLGAWAGVHAQTDTILRRSSGQLFGTQMFRGAERFAATLRTDGSWPDIDYGDSSRSVWKTAEHLERLQRMAVAWADPLSPRFHSDSLEGAIHKAFDYWLYHRFYNPNWWYNEIGVPQLVGNILILLRGHLSRYERIRGLEEMDQYRINGTGSNLIWSAGLGFHYGALTDDTALMTHCIDTILHEIRVNTAEGIQPDYSFHMHGDRLQIYSYGYGYLSDCIMLALQCRGTPWAFPQDKLALLADFVLRGWSWMARGIHTVPGTIDRGVSRKGGLDAADIRSLLPGLVLLCPGRADSLSALGERQNGKGRPLSGFRYFPYSDFAAFQGRDFSFFLKTISTRTLPCESINGENLKGHMLNSGGAYLVADGSEYYDLMPVLDWNKLPGTTTFEGAAGILRRPFSGSVSDGKSGLTAMDYRMRAAGKGGITARKAWVCHGGVILCLIAGLTAEGYEGPVVTVLDQCRLKGPVSVNGRLLKGKGTDTISDVRYIHHGNFAYLPLGPSTVAILRDTVSGTWSSINRGESDSTVRDSVFTALLLHGKDASDDAAAYVLAYASTAATSAGLATHPFWKILRNDTLCQAAAFSDGILCAAFFGAGRLKVPGGAWLTVSRPCLLLWSGRTLYLSDPLHLGGNITVHIGRRNISGELPGDGTTMRRPFTGR